MFRFIIRRLLVTVPMVLIVITLTWGLIRLAPGNFYSGERKLPAAIEKNIRAKYGLDQPVVRPVRADDVATSCALDFGTSLQYEGRDGQRDPPAHRARLGRHRHCRLPARARSSA